MGRFVLIVSASLSLALVPALLYIQMLRTAGYVHRLVELIEANSEV